MQTQPPLIPLGSKGYALVDPERLEELSRYRWFVLKSKSGAYAARRFIRNGKAFYIRMHRQIMNAPAGFDVHHLNGNKFDNRLGNLMLVSPEIHAHYRKGKALPRD